MSKKVKCIECIHCTRFAIPVSVTKNNVDLVEEILNYVSNKIVCSRTERTKLENNEQYCNHFKVSEDMQKINTILFKKKRNSGIKRKI